MLLGFWPKVFSFLKCVSERIASKALPPIKSRLDKIFSSGRLSWSRFKGWCANGYAYGMAKFAASGLLPPFQGRYRHPSCALSGSNKAEFELVMRAFSNLFKAELIAVYSNPL